MVTGKVPFISASLMTYHAESGEHKQKRAKGFTSKYNINQLLYCESFSNIEDAISVEKQIKGWVRKKKLELIRTLNPAFSDLSKEWLQGDE